MVGVTDPMVALACLAQNITPKTLTMDIDGRTLGSRLRDGESLGSIIGLAQVHRTEDGAASA